MSNGQGNQGVWNPWDTSASGGNVSGQGVSGGQGGQGGAAQSEMFFDPFGSFATEAPAGPGPAAPASAAGGSTTMAAPKPVAPVAMDPFGALNSGGSVSGGSVSGGSVSGGSVSGGSMSGNAASGSSNASFVPPPSSSTPDPTPSTTTTMAFSSDFMDLLAGPQAASSASSAADAQLMNVTTALDDFFGSPAPTSGSNSETSAPASSTAPTETKSGKSSYDDASASSSTATASSSTASTAAAAAPKREAPRAMTTEEKDREDEVLRSFELKGNLEKLSQGLLGESWKPKWVTFKTNRFAYYEQKTDPRPKYYVYLDECDVGLPKNMTQSYDFNHSFQLVNERKGTTWYFRTGGVADLKKWTQSFAASIAHYKERNQDTTIYERLLTLACVRYRSVEQYRSFHFYTSKQSTGSYAIAACILIELLIRRCIDITSHENVILHADVRYQGIGVLDDTLDLLSQKLRMQREFRLAEFIPMLLCSSAFVFGDLSLDAPVLRCIDSSVKRGTLKRGQTPKDWHVSNLTLEDELIKTFHSLTKSPYTGTDVREHATLGICYTVMRALNKTDTPVQDVLDRGKIFPELHTRSQLDSALDAMAKNLGPFERKHTLVLKAIFTQLVQFISGAGQYPSNSR